MVQSFPGYFFIARATLFKVAVSNGQITFQLSSPCTGDYSSLGKGRIFSKLACDLFFRPCI